MRRVSLRSLVNLGEGGLPFCYNYLVYYVYILQLKDNSYYHGSALDLKNRIEDHKNGIVSSTKNLRPFKIVFYAAFISKIKALQFEKYLKTTSGWAFRNKHLT
jgi:putative endonuclease